MTFRTIVAAVAEADTGKKTTIIIHVEQPDIILVEQMDDINCLALFFNVILMLTRINRPGYLIV